MASVDRHDLDVSNFSQEAGGPVCLTHHFISSVAGRPSTSWPQRSTRARSAGHRGTGASWRASRCWA